MTDASVSGSPLSDPRPYDPDGRGYFSGFDPRSVPSPCFVVDRTAVAHNLAMLRAVADAAEARVMLALKAFALPATFDLVARYLDGVCASGVHEARLGREEIAPLRADFPSARPFEVHTFAPAYTPQDLAQIATLSDHIVFNSPMQWQRLRRAVPAAASAQIGLRVNPEHPVGETPLYDPSAPYSRLGITASELARQLSMAGESPAPGGGGRLPALLDGITGIHMHTLCENDSHALAVTLDALEERFGWLLASPAITWLNIGGGHHITKPHYDRDHLVSLIRRMRERYHVEVIMEPGEAAAIHSGILVSSVVDIMHNGMALAILDTSATAHMPDTLEMPYRAEVWGSRHPDEAPEEWPRYRLGGQTCLAGDVMGDYAFPAPLKIGERIVFDDMSHYTMVKTTTFNGIALPAIATWDAEHKSVAVHRTSSYRDFRERLG